MDFFKKKLNSPIALRYNALSALYRRVIHNKICREVVAFCEVLFGLSLRYIFSLFYKKLLKHSGRSVYFKNSTESKVIFFLPLFLYGALTYWAALWWLFPLFLASCFYTLCLVSSHSRFLACQRFLLTLAWSFLAALILIFPCLVVLLEFRSLAATVGAIFLLVYAAIIVAILVTFLVTVGRVCVRNNMLKLLSWTSIFVAWWWCVDNLFFACVGVSCGYVIANPVLCCAVSPLSCALVVYVGLYGLLALHGVMAGGCVMWLVYRSRACGLIALGALGVLGIFGSFALRRELSDRSTLNRCVISKDTCSIKSAGGMRLAGEPSIGKNLVRPPWESIVAFKLTGRESGIHESGIREKGVLEIALELQRQFLVCSERAVMPDLIVGPESCVPCVLNNEPSLCALFDNPGLCRLPRVLLGARRQEEDTTVCKNKKCFNTAFMLHQGRIIYLYDKQFPLPFLETYFPTYPTYCNFTFLHGLVTQRQKVTGAKHSATENSSQNGLFFSKGKTPYAPGTKADDVSLTLGGVTYNARLALCSDFFCTDVCSKDNYSKDSSSKKVCTKDCSLQTCVADLFSLEKLFPGKIFSEKKSPDKLSSEKAFLKNNPLCIVLTHDTWFYGTSVADRMHRYAVLWAVQHQIPVLYVGNQYASWIERSGRVWPLATVDS